MIELLEDCELVPATPHTEPNVQQYVLGFAFSQSMRSVVLITKKKPAWQAGCLNGVGGKIESTDKAPRFAMTREFLEETGWPVMPAAWILIEVMRFRNGAVVHCFATRLLEHAVVNTMEEEEVDGYPVDEFGQLTSELRIIKNLRWLVPKAFHQIYEPPEERLLVE